MDVSICIISASALLVSVEAAEAAEAVVAAELGVELEAVVGAAASAAAPPP